MVAVIPALSMPVFDTFYWEPPVNVKIKLRIITLAVMLAAILSVTLTLFHARGISGLALFGSQEVRDYLLTAFSRPIVWFQLMRFVLSWLLLYFLWAGLLYFSLQPLVRGLSRKKQAAVFLLAFIFSLLWLYALNTYFYPDSSGAILTAGFFQSPFFLLIPGLVFLALLLWSVFDWWQQAAVRQRFFLAGVALVLGGVVFAGLSDPQNPHGVDVLKDGRLASDAKGRANPLPNVIILGIDALRPDHVGINGFSPSVTPFLDYFLQDFTIYDTAYTPLARTFAAWVSILSGQYPLHNGARFNLTAPQYVKKENQIQNRLKQAGYATYYAIDERRFNNIDESYGFDKVIGPKMGFSDMLLSPFSDDPLLNLVSQTRLGHWLFPFSHVNRGHHKLYDPYDFVDEIMENLPPDNSQPVFLAAHLTLPHWPFVNKNMPDIPFPFDKRDKDVEEYYYYLSMLRQADDQLRYLVNRLKDRGLLDNAEIFVISDHGESFNFPGDGPDPAIPAASFTTIERGHGTNVLSLKQYRVLLAHLAAKKGTLNQGQPERKGDLRSLVDIAPSIAQSVGLKLPAADGIPLSQTVSKDRAVFLESSINPQSISRKRLDVVQAIAEGVAFYTVNEQGLVEVKKELMPSIIAAKQRAVIQGEWELAYFPDMKNDLIIVNLKENTWWPTRFAPANAPVKKLLLELCEFYKEDKGFDSQGYCQNPDVITQKALQEPEKDDDKNQPEK